MSRKRILLVAVLAFTSLALFTGFASATPTTTVGANVNITKAAGNQTEGTIAVDPTNALQLFSANNGGAGTTFWRSTDAGATWVAAGTGIAASCCDEVAAWDPFGNLFLVNINAALNAINLFLSTDGGATFTLLQVIDTGGVDQPSVKAGAGSVWVTWNDGGIKARGAAVTGLGAANIGAFTAEQAAPGTSGQFGDIEIGPGGQVVVTYQSSTACPCTIFANTDADGLGAVGFAAQVAVSSTNVNTFDFIPAQDSRSIDAEANLAWDRSGGTFDGRLYIAYTDESPDESNDTDNFVRFSTDNGATWSAPVRVNDDATTTSQFLPNISLDQTTGNLAVTWHDARNDAANNNAQFFGAVSDDGGASFGANFLISGGTSNDDGAGSGVDYGDYTSSTFDAGVLYPTWADNSNSTGDNPAGAGSTFDMYTAAVSIGGDGTPPVIAPHGPESAEATGPGGAVVTYTAPATSDNVDPPGVATCVPASGSTFPLGPTTVDCDAVDVAGNHAVQTHFTVTVVDTTPPAFTPPADITVPAVDASGTAVTYVTPTATDIVDGTDPVVCLPASGSTFPVGATTVSCSATDAHLNATTHTFTVTVLSARVAKQAVLAALQALAPVDAATDKKISQAIKHLQKSLDNTGWVDDMHLAKGGRSNSVFNEEKATVKELTSLKNPSAGLAASISGWIDSLVAADRTLATTAISEGGSANDLDKANSELAKGDSDRSSGNFGNAIDHFRNAWKALDG